MEEQGKYYRSGARVYAASLDNVVAGCRNGEAPPCTAACPYGLDVRGFMQKLQRGSFRGAYNLMAEQLIFPQTLCAICGAPCRQACAKELGGAAVGLPELEQAVFAYRGDRKASRFRIPPKAEKIAVVGAGLCGLSCAHALAAQGYTVQVFERGAQIGGSLHAVLSPELFLPELTERMDLPNVQLALERPVTQAQELSEFSCVLLATGADGTDLDYAAQAQPEKFFLAGELTGAAKTDAVTCGRQAAAAMDAYLKTGVRTAQAAAGRTERPPLQPTQRLAALSKEEAAAEAARCRLCDCRRCIENCTLLQYYKKSPQKVVADVKVTLNPVDGLMARTATRLICSCSDCGLCKDVCPEAIDMGTLLMEARTVMNSEGSISPVFHDFWMRDMAFSCSEKAAWYRPSENGDLFFPGCQLGASSPDYVEQAYALLQKRRPGTGILLGCCGVPAKWAGETEQFEQRLDELRRLWREGGRPRFITACPTCKRTLREALPEIEVVSLYALLADSDAPEPRGGSETVAVFHPCSSRNDPAEQESVRALLRRAGVQPTELEDPADRDGCCGFGGHIYPAGPEVYRQTVERRAASSELPYVTYCVNCRDVFTAKGKDCRHILDVLTGMDHRRTALPSLQQRRANRVHLKSILSGEPETEEATMNLIMSDELREKLNEMLILDEDLEAVIENSERTARYLKKPNGDCVGHLRQGCVTYWAVWRREGEQVRLVNAYSHRMVIEGE